MPRRVFRNFGFFLILALLLATFGCAKAPYTNRSQMILMSSQEELALGMQASRCFRNPKKKPAPRLRP